MNYLFLFGIVFLFMFVVIAIMSVGVIFSNKPIKGSCGGLNAVGVDGECKVCGKAPEAACDSPLVKELKQNRSTAYDAMQDKDMG